MNQLAALSLSAGLLWQLTGAIASSSLGLPREQAQAVGISAPAAGPRIAATLPVTNSEFAVSLRYPRGYSVKEKTDSAAWQMAQDLAAVQPGARLLVTLAAPFDAHRSSTFRAATFQLVVNPVVSAPICRSLAVPLDDAYTTGSTTIRGINFNWRERGSAAAGTGYLNRNYAGFWRGNCYEFFLEVITASNPDANPNIRDVDPNESMKQLAAIASSLRIRCSSTARSQLRTVPVIRSFAVQWIPHSVLQNVLRVSWEIAGATENQVFLRANSADYTVLNPLPDGDGPDPYSRVDYFKLESVFSCGRFRPIPPRSGTFRLQIENAAEPGSFTLFVYGLPYVTEVAH